MANHILPAGVRPANPAASAEYDRPWQAMPTRAAAFGRGNDLVVAAEVMNSITGTPIQLLLRGDLHQPSLFASVEG